MNRGVEFVFIEGQRFHVSRTSDPVVRGFPAGRRSGGALGETPNGLSATRYCQRPTDNVNTLLANRTSRVQKRSQLIIRAHNKPPPIIAATVRLHCGRSSPPLNISDNVANTLDGLLGSIPLWAHLHQLAPSDSLLLVLLCPQPES